MTELLTAAQMRAIEEAAIASGEVTGLELMERAGRGVVEAVFGHWPELAATPHRAVVFCGPGNNGGDGFVVARLLKERGWEVALILYGDAGKLPPDARVNYERWAAMGAVRLLGFPTIDEAAVEDVTRVLGAPAGEKKPDLVVDAIFGTGLTRPPEALAMLFDIWERMHENAFERVVAVDLPTGLCSDSGRLLGPQVEPGAPCPCLNADLTVSFHRPKLGHYLGAADRRCGRLAVADIGLDAYQPEDALGICRLARPWFGPRSPGRHKYDHGHALVLTGTSGRTGAARLAARGALRAGAGLVTLGAPGNAFQEVACQITALMLRRVDDAAGLHEMLEDTRFNALCLGPGLGGERARGLVPAALKAGRATVLDADALTAYTGHASALFGMLHESCVLTPHGGEFARLFPDIAAKLDDVPGEGPAYSKVDAARQAANRAGCVVLLKGADTVIAAPDGRCALNSAQYERAAPWLATAGSGDVLAGFIVGLLARGLDPLYAAETAAWLHVEAALAFGRGLIAEDLPEALPPVLRALAP